MLVLVFDDDTKEAVGRFETEAVPRVGDRIELVPLARSVNWRNWDVRGVHWVVRLEGSEDAGPDNKGTLGHICIDAVEVVRTDQLPHPWNLG
jgi:hypothetical protein